jgi:hypothetical protein
MVKKYTSFIAGFLRKTRKHFVGEVENCEDGVIRAVGNLFVIEDVKENIFHANQSGERGLSGLIVLFS